MLGDGIQFITDVILHVGWWFYMEESFLKLKLVVSIFIPIHLINDRLRSFLSLVKTF